MKCYWIISLLLISFLSCTNRIYLHRIKGYFNSDNIKSRGRWLSEDCHSYFIEKKGDGEDKVSALNSFLNWDAPLHPDLRILNYTVKGNICTIEFNEQNDFSKLIQYPGWKGTEIIRFNSKKLIDQVIYIPANDNPDYKTWLKPAVDWLQNKYPDEIIEIYKGGKLIKNPVTARKWVLLLQRWRKVTGSK
ncbi:MAG TPA: hypothetical protein VK588_09930 [Chitinophagaceae bacterium]|nr:hypothetical protein [Chitinophagaceae bacterium]